MKKENKTLEGLFREQSTVARSGEKITPQFLIDVRHKHLVGVHIAVQSLSDQGSGPVGDVLDFTVVDNKLIPHFVTTSGNGMSYCEAKDAIYLESLVARPGWIPGSYIALQVPDENSKMTEPYLYKFTAIGPDGLPPTLAPYHPTQDDLNASDWVAISAPAIPAPEPETATEVAPKTAANAGSKAK